MKLLVHVDFSMHKRFEHFKPYVDTKSQVQVEFSMHALSRGGEQKYLPNTNVHSKCLFMRTNGRTEKRENSIQKHSLREHKRASGQESNQIDCLCNACYQLNTAV